MTWTIDVEYATHDTLKAGAAAALHSEQHTNGIYRHPPGGRRC